MSVDTSRIATLYTLAMDISDSGAIGANRSARGHDGIDAARRTFGAAFDEMYNAACALLHVQNAAHDAERGYVPAPEVHMFYSPRAHVHPNGRAFAGWVRPDMRPIARRLISVKGN